MSQDVHIVLPADGLYVSLPLNRRLTVSIHIPAQSSEDQRVPGIGFRLYANDEAQLAELERSSGDRELDQAAYWPSSMSIPFLDSQPARVSRTSRST